MDIRPNGARQTIIVRRVESLIWSLVMSQLALISHPLSTKYEEANTTHHFWNFWPLFTIWKGLILWLGRVLGACTSQPKTTYYSAEHIDFCRAGWPFTLNQSLRWKWRYDILSCLTFVTAIDPKTLPKPIKMSESFPNLKQIELAGNLATSLFILMILVQVGVASTVLPSTILWGGSQDVITVKLQIASMVAAALLAFMAFIINLRCSHATLDNLRTTAPPSWLSRSSWFITAYMGLNTLGNAASSNSIERYGFGAVTVVLFGCCCIVSSAPVQENTPPTRQFLVPV